MIAFATPCKSSPTNPVVLSEWAATFDQARFGPPEKIRVTVSRHNDPFVSLGLFLLAEHTHEARLRLL